MGILYHSSIAFCQHELFENDLTRSITAVASTATAVGVIIAVIQLFTLKLAKTEFEDQFRRDYRDICSNLPVKVFLGHRAMSSEDSLNHFHLVFSPL